MARVLSIGLDRLLMAIRTRVLQRAGYRVNEAYSTREARLVAASWKIDLVLICHTVPEAELMELIMELRFSRPKLPILCISSNKHYADNERCSVVDNLLPAFLTDVNAALQRTGTRRVE